MRTWEGREQQKNIPDKKTERIWSMNVLKNLRNCTVANVWLLLLLSCFSCVWLCATPETAAHQACPSLGFSRQEHWSGLPCPSPTHESEKWKWSRSVVSDPQRSHGLQTSRLLRPWDFPGKSTGVGCHCLLCKFYLFYPKYVFPSLLSPALLLPVISFTRSQIFLI